MHVLGNYAKKKFPRKRRGLENDNTQQKAPSPNKSDFKVPYKYVRNSENLSANNRYISTSNRYQELSKNDDIENENNTEDYVKPANAAESNRTNSGKTKRSNSDTRKKLTNPIIHCHKKTQQHVKKYDNVTVILGDSLVKNLKGWELSNDKRKTAVKSFRGAKTCYMHFHAKLTIEKMTGKYYHLLWH